MPEKIKKKKTPEEIEAERKATIPTLEDPNVRFRGELNPDKTTTETARGITRTLTPQEEKMLENTNVAGIITPNVQTLLDAKAQARAESQNIKSAQAKAEEAITINKFLEQETAGQTISPEQKAATMPITSPVNIPNIKEIAGQGILEAAGIPQIAQTTLKQIAPKGIKEKIAETQQQIGESAIQLGIGGSIASYFGASIFNKIAHTSTLTKLLTAGGITGIGKLKAAESGTILSNSLGEMEDIIKEVEEERMTDVAARDSFNEINKNINSADRTIKFISMIDVLKFMAVQDTLEKFETARRTTLPQLEQKLLEASQTARMKKIKAIAGLI
jgi:hypothetical protein